MKLVDIKVVAKLLNVRPKTLYDWCYKKLIPSYKINGLLRFDEEEIMKWLGERKQFASDNMMESACTKNKSKQ